MDNLLFFLLFILYLLIVLLFAYGW
jgi:hypothetical protein